MLFRLLLTLIVSRIHPLFPDDFDLSALPHPPCRIFNRPAFTQHSCGACAAFAVATAYAVRECVKSGRDVIPSPHHLFNCASGDCAAGAVLGSVVGVLNGGGVQDVDSVEVVEFGDRCEDGGFNHSGRDWLSHLHHNAVFHIKQDDELMIKTELYVYRNPVLVVIEPDVEMSLYSRAFWSSRSSLRIGDSIQLSDGSWARINSHNKLRSPVDHAIPVYHITGTPLLPHVVVVLGWGTVPEPHWIVQNSWGSGWGDNGRGKIAMHDVIAAVVLDAKLWTDDWLMLATLAVIFAIASAAEVAVCCWGWRGVRVKEKVDDDEDTRLDFV